MNALTYYQNLVQKYNSILINLIYHQLDRQLFKTIKDSLPLLIIKNLLNFKNKDKESCQKMWQGILKFLEWNLNLSYKINNFTNKNKSKISNKKSLCKMLKSLLKSNLNILFL